MIIQKFLPSLALQPYSREFMIINVVCITVALWENIAAVNQAKEKVQELYRKQGFDLSKMFRRLNISIERGIYRKADE